MLILIFDYQLSDDQYAYSRYMSFDELRGRQPR
jgi:hypothetical protein